MDTGFEYGLKVSPLKIFSNHKGENISVQWRNPADAIFSKWSRLISPIQHVNTINMVWPEKDYLLCGFLPSAFHRILRKHQINQNHRTSYKITHPYLTKALRSRKTGKIEEPFQMVGD